jgi:hypothetical protein
MRVVGSGGRKEEGAEKVRRKENRVKVKFKL